MIPQADFVQPPRLAVWLVTLFAPAEQAEAILGDLLEEFFQLASKSGVGCARSWYWRQSVRTSAQLACGGLSAAPWSTVTAVVGGFLLAKFAFRWPEQAIFAVLDRYQVYDHHFTVYKFWIGDGIVIGLVVLHLIVGGIVAVVAKGREMTATIALGFIRSALGVIGALLTLIRYEHGWTLWPMLHQFAFSIAMVAGGVIVRTWRLAGMDRRSAA
ncbi:MAG: permease prefix domain 2-containing transporter [Bryobacteraceae bacterium]